MKAPERSHTQSGFEIPEEVSRQVEQVYGFQA